jgi:hypothetical protein
MERNVNAGEGDGGKPTLEFDVPFSFLLFQCTLMARFDDITQHFLDLLDGISLSQLNQMVSTQ